MLNLFQELDLDINYLLLNAYQNPTLEGEKELIVDTFKQIGNFKRIDPNQFLIKTHITLENKAALEILLEINKDNMVKLACDIVSWYANVDNKDFYKDAVPNLLKELEGKNIDI